MKTTPCLLAISFLSIISIYAQENDPFILEWVPPPGAVFECKDDTWDMIRNRCYKVFTSGASYDDASSQCISEGAVIATPTNTRTNDELGNLVGSPFWIGLQATDGDDEYAAVLPNGDESHLTISPGWDFQQPDLSAGDCIQSVPVSLPESSEDTYKWQLTSCGDLLPYVCESRTCLSGQYQCLNDKCIGEDQVCDEVNDCGDFSDEIDCPRLGCVQLFDGESGTISSPGWPSDYQSELNCRWTIQGPIGRKISFTLDTSGQTTNFITEENFDVVDIWAGGKTISTSYHVAKLSGDLSSQEPITYVSSNNHMVITLSTDRSSQERGFSGSWNTKYSCDMGYIMGYHAEGTVINTWTNRNEDACESHCVDRVDCNSFLYEIDARTCSFFSDVGAPSKNDAFNYWSKRCKDTVGTDPIDILPGSGGRPIASSSPQQIMSPSFPLDYYSNLRLSWTVTSTFTIITFQKIYIDLLPGDEVTIHDGDQQSGPVLASYTDDGLGPMGYDVVMTTTQAGVVHFHSESLGNARGFLIEFQAGCNIEITAKSGILQSPGFGPGMEYPSLQTCSWTISSPDANEIAIEFSSFSVDSTDSVQVYDGIDDSGTALHSSSGFSNNNLPVLAESDGTYRSSAGSLFLKFTADAALTDTGFQARFSIDCRDPMFNENTQVIGGDRNDVTLREFGKEFEIQCAPGYYFSAEEFDECDADVLGGAQISMECSYGGKWNYDQIPACSRVYCGFPEPVRNGFVKNITSVVFEGEAIYECFEGFNLNGGDTATCESDGTWTNLPSCQAHDCQTNLESSVSSPLNIMFNNTPVDDQGNENTQAYGVVATFFCDDGYDLDMTPQGSEPVEPVVYCTAFSPTESRWTAEGIPNCIPVKCEVPEIDLGRLAHPAPNGATVAPGSLVDYPTTLEFHCDPGYARNGTFEVKCESESSFGILPYCEDRDECADGNHGCESGEQCENSIGSYHCTCLEGYMLDANGRDCIDIKECDENNGGCSDTCVEADGSYECTCENGYELFREDGYNGFNTKTSETGFMEGDIYRFNHTCVPKTCPPEVWEDLQNAQVLSTREYFYFDDVVEILCDLGFVISGGDTSANLRCKADGTWEGAVPDCQAAQCASLTLPGALLNPPELSNTGPVAYGDIVILTCTDEFDIQTTREMECVYDITTGTYELRGAELECGEINCGQPQGVPGMDTSVVGATTYLSTFEFTCQPGFDQSGESGDGSITVTCTEEGYWNLGNLACTGPTCTDPGKPPESRQIVTSYEQGEELNFECTRQGYEPDRAEPMVCTLVGSDLVWEPDELPECVDTEDPVFDNCGAEIFEAARFQLLTDISPSVTDNTGIDSLEPDFDLNAPILQETNVTWTATDYAGNSAQCQVTVRLRDEVPPSILCDTSAVEVILDTINAEIEKNSDDKIFVTSDDGPFSATYDPETFVASIDTIDETIGVAYTATDSNGNTNTCYFSYVVKAAECQDWYLPEPANGNKQCDILPDDDGNPKGRKCTMTCDANYIFFGQVEQNVVYNCEEGNSGGSGEWELAGGGFAYVPDCIARSPAVYVQEYNMVYVNQDGTAATTSCFNGYLNDVNTKSSAVALGLRDLCRGATGNENVEVTVETDADSLNVLLSTLAVTYRIVIGPDNLDASALSQCSNYIETSVSYGIISSEDSVTHDWYELSDNGACGIRQVQDSISQLADGFECSGGVQQTDNEGNIVCAPCSTGSYAFDGACNLCDVGSYTDIAGETECHLCPDGTSTKHAGANDADLCRAMCPPGYFSDDGMTPCEQCAVDTYWMNPTHCEPCGEDFGTNGVTGNPGFDGCLEKCTPGFISHNGFAPCIPCPRGYYQSLSQQTECILCSSPSETTASLNSTSQDDCTSAVADLCTPETCSNHGTCDVVQSQVNCECDQGYTGLSCETSIDPCLSRPCYNNGRCIANDDGSYTCQCDGIPAAVYILEEDQAVGGTVDDQFTMSLSECQQYCYDHPDCGVLTYVDSSQTCYIYHKEFSEIVLTPFGDADTYQVNITTVSVFSGDHCETDENDCEGNNECEPNGMCQDDIQGFNCLCLPTYSGNRCQTSQPICENSPCVHGQCEALSEPADEANRRRCICEAGYTGEDCETDIDDCDPDPCFYGFPCSDGVNGFSCECDNGFFGDRCENRPLNLCTDDFNCGNAGQCIEDYRVSSPMCMCDEGAVSDSYWTQWYDVSNPEEDGEDDETLITHLAQDQFECSEPIDIECRLQDTRQLLAEVVLDDHLHIPCTLEEGLLCFNSNQTDGMCDNYAVRYRCMVDGITCRQIDECNAEPCLNDVDCQDARNDYRCLCPDGLSGHNCQHNVDDCEGDPCNGGECTDGIDSYTCECPDGFTGDSCETNEDDCQNFCDPNNSDGCEDLINDYHCICNAGFTGKNCTEDINECDSNPCLHNVECRNLVDDYECVCPDGFTDKRCETLVEHCTPDYCQNGGICHNVYDGSYCACLDGTSGDQCQIRPSLCDAQFDSLICLNGGDCQEEDDGGFSCGCPDDFTGRGCQCERDFCHGQESICMNDGVCEENELGTDYTCTCKEGFSGDTCEINDDDCATHTCTDGTCIDGVGQAFCKCPFGRSGPTCDKTIDRDYDLVFNGEGGTFQLHPFVLNSSEIAVALWIRPDISTEGTFLCLYSAESQESQTVESKKLCLNNDGAELYLDGSDTATELEYFESITLNDGSWHSIILSFSSETSTAELTADFVTTDIENYASGVDLSEYAVILLGGEESIDEDPFSGSITRVFVWDRLLSDAEKVAVGDVSDMNVISDGLVADWDGYSLEGSVQRLLGTLLCQDGVGNGCTQTADGIVPPSLNSECPADIVTLGNNAAASVEWTRPIFEDAESVVQNYAGESETFNPGIYEVMYLALGPSETSDECTFQVTVKLQDCPIPDAPEGGNAPVCNDYPAEHPFYRYCSVSCPDGFGFLEPVPNMYTCGAEGLWDVQDPSGFFKFPACGELGTAELDVFFGWEATLATVPNDNLLNSIATGVGNSVRDWTNTPAGSGFCRDSSCTGLECVATYVTDREVVLINCSISEVPTQVGNEGLDVVSALTKAALQDQVIGASAVSGAEVADPQTFFVNTVVVCDPGYQEVAGQCVECTVGTYYSEGGCVKCAKGFFQDQTQQTECQQCDDGFTTAGEGSSDSAECFESCPAGQYYDLVAEECTDCGRGKYQSEPGQTRCDICESGTTTHQTNATDVTDCIDDCPSGYRLLADATCEECPVGTYRSQGIHFRCQSCTDGFTTAGPASETESACNLVLCQDGWYRNGTDPGVCMECEIGSWRNGPEDMENCTKCPDGMTTDDVGSTMENDCRFFCPAGFYIMTNAQNVSSCEICPHHTYKADDDPNDKYLELCIPCPDTLPITQFEGATTIDACNFANCTAGYIVNDAYRTDPNSEEPCTICDFGQYQPNPQPTNDTCMECPVGTSTEREGAVNEDECRISCPSGEEALDGENCTPCVVGYYKDNGVDASAPFALCTICNEDFITDGIGSASASDCTVANCSAGSKRENNECVLCPIGTYQDQKWQTECLPCPEDYVTANNGSTEEAQCNLTPNRMRFVFLIVLIQETFINALNDPLSTESLAIINDILPALISEFTALASIDYKDMAFSGFGSGSVLSYWDIQVGIDTTEQNIIDALQDILAPGEIAGYPVNNEDVPLVASKSNTALNSRFCENGEQFNIGTVECEPCPVDTYDNENSALDVCAVCPDGQGTRGEGSVGDEESACFRICPPGQQEGIDQCVPCSSGTYKEGTNADQCEPCGGDAVTDGDGATSMDDCYVSCAAGQYPDENNNCVNCPPNEVSEAGQPSCEPCPDGLETTGSGESQCSDPCALYGDDLCNGHGTCEWQGDRGSACQCDGGYIGIYCEDTEDDCNYCNGHGTCTFDNFENTITCDCDSPYEGEQCETRGEGQDDAPLIIGLTIGLFGAFMILVLLIVLICRLCRPKQPKYKKYQSSPRIPQAIPMAAPSHMYAQHSAVAPTMDTGKPYYPAGIGGVRQPVILGTPSQTLNKMPAPFMFYEDKDDHMRSASQLGYANSFFQGQ